MRGRWCRCVVCLMSGVAAGVCTHKYVYEFVHSSIRVLSLTLPTCVVNVCMHVFPRTTPTLRTVSVTQQKSVPLVRHGDGQSTFHLKEGIIGNLYRLMRDHKKHFIWEPAPPPFFDELSFNTLFLMNMYICFVVHTPSLHLYNVFPNRPHT